MEQPFNCNDAPPPEDFSPIPANTEVVLSVIESETTEPNTNGNAFYRLKFEVLEGEHKGRIISDSYTYRSPNQKAQNIGLRKLRNVCESLGMAGFRTTSELHGKPMRAKLGLDKPNNNGDVYNNIKKTMPYGQAPTQTTPAPSTATTAESSQVVTQTAAPESTPAQAPAAKKPWEM